MLIGMIPPNVVVRAQEDPPAPGGLFSLVTLLCVLMIVSVVLRRALRGRRGAKGLFAFSVGVGNALMDLGGVLQPDRANVQSVQKAEITEIEQSVGDGRRPERPRPRNWLPSRVRDPP